MASLVVALLVTTFAASSALGQTATDADALIAQGVERRRAGDDEGGLELFTQAWEAGHTPRARAQMALAEQALGHFVDAETHMLEALAANDDAWITARRADLERALEAIRLRLGYLEVRGGVDGADLRLDGRSVGTLPMEEPIRLAAGSYRLEVVAPQHYPFARQITIVPEGTTRETVVLARTPDAPGSVAVGDARPQPSDASPDAPRGLHPAVGASLLGAGGALLVTSVVTFSLRQGRARDYNSDACLMGDATRGETCGGLYRDAMRAQRASAATLTLGAALALAGTLTFILGPRPDDDARAAEPSVACGASIGSTWGGQCRLRF